MVLRKYQEDGRYDNCNLYSKLLSLDGFKSNGYGKARDIKIIQPSKKDDIILIPAT